MIFHFSHFLVREKHSQSVTVKELFELVKLL